jgi:hypothetical protein
MFGTIFVATIGMALPIAVGVWFMPRSESSLPVAIPGLSRGRWLLLRQGRRCLVLLGAAVFKGHVPDNFAASARVG